VTLDYAEIAGMPVALLARRERETVGIALHVRAGWRFEGAGERGSAHFLEHLVLRGSRRFPGRRAVTALEHSPRGFFAGTNREYGLFETHVPAQLGVRGVRALLDAVFHPRLDGSDIAVERSVVLDELQWRSRDTARALLDSLFSDLAGIPLIAAAEAASIRTLDADALRRYHAAWFQPRRAGLAVTGALDSSEILDAIATILGEHDGTLAQVVVAPSAELPRPLIVEVTGHERTWLLIAHVANGVDWRAHVVGRAIVQEANATGRGSVTRALRDSTLHLYSWECAYYALGDLALLAVFVEAPPELAEQAARAAGTGLDAALAIQERRLWAVAQEQHALAFDSNERAARFLAERVVAEPRLGVSGLAPERTGIGAGLAQLRCGARVVVAHTSSGDLAGLRQSVAV
jgi:hypothetical protein